MGRAWSLGELAIRFAKVAHWFAKPRTLKLRMWDRSVHCATSMCETGVNWLLGKTQTVKIAVSS